MTSPADELRTAATKLRELLARAVHEDRTRWFPAATLGSKSPVVVDDADQPSVLIETYAARLEAVNRYIATMGPNVGTVLADWLDAEAADPVAVLHSPSMCCDPACAINAALAVARAINGTQEAGQ
jgi:hypothetical protein